MDISKFLKLKKLANSKSIKISKQKLENVINKYEFLHISSEFNFEQNQNTFQKFKESKTIIIEVQRPK